MLKHRFFFALHALLLLIFISGSANGQETETDVSSDSSTAMNVLQQMGDYLKSAEQFHFHAEVTVDKVRNSGQKLQFERTLDAYVRRPNKIRVNVLTELGPVRFSHDGKKITLFTLYDDAYATSEAPAAIDEALDFAVEKFGIPILMADFLFSDPYRVLTENVVTAYYVGIDRVRGKECHHLAFTQETIDWQIWIDAGETALPQKLVITYKQEPGQPQFSGVFTEWNLSSQLPDLFFTFKAPAGANEFQFFSEITLFK